MLRALAFILLFSLLLPAQDRAIAVVPSGERRVALLIGNDNYSGIPLKNAVNDAKAMGTALKELAFEVEVVTNADRRGEDRAVDRFISRLGVNSVGLFFYAGHGIQVEGENYLLGVDFVATTEEDAKYLGLPVSLVMDRLQKAKARLSVVILDACRDNPFRGSRGTNRGLAVMNAGRGSFIAFATSPGQTAADVGPVGGGNGLFTACLLENLKQPDLDIDQVFARTREKVYAGSGQKQLPWTASSVIGNFVFRDLSSQERQVTEEKARLEVELAKLQADKVANQIRLGAAETLRQEQRVREQLRMKDLEEKRIAEEADRRTHLQADAAQMDEATRAQAAQREQQRKAEEARLGDLKRKLEVERSDLGNSGTLGRDQARTEVASLREKKANVEGRIFTERDKALAQVTADYVDLLQKAAASPTPRDEFETTAQYQARLAEHDQAKAAVENRLRQERANLEARYSREAGEQGGPYDRQIKVLKDSKYRVPFRVELNVYDPDRGVYNLSLKGKEDEFFIATLKVSPNVARGLKTRAELLRAEGEEGLEGGVERVMLLDPSLGQVEMSDFQVSSNPVVAFVVIPAGSFTMGGSERDEQPRHKVNISSFRLGKTAVTQAQWQAVMGNNPSHFNGPDFPVERVSWDDCQKFISRLNAKGEGTYRLPTEAEWEYACRAGSTGERYGDLDAKAWYQRNSGQKTHPVGQKQPNAWGLYDMNGNVWQWCQDWYEENSYGSSPSTDPEGPSSGSGRVSRGGGWNSTATDVRSAFRLRHAPVYRFYDLGFRLLRTIP